MRTIRSFVTAVVATAILVTGLLLTGPSVKAVGPDTEQGIYTGQVVAIDKTTITIHKASGVYTYQLSPMARQASDVARIRPGDRVYVTVYDAWGIASNVKKL